LQQNTHVFRYHNGTFELMRGWTESGTTAIARGTSGAVLLSSSAVGTLTYSDNRFRSLSSTALLTDATSARRQLLLPVSDIYFCRLRGRRMSTAGDRSEARVVVVGRSRAE
jgi:hypothetical protein